ncbi:hypothetical protein [Engelhardtia mirabilis]|uniref:ABC-type transport auxiliary lipoprotein component domain-containing protein n=1 Tax=Engelhardtia mirabilis TaxID=2528011 RepID=A0A518BNH1_9BACT|nr:hypothetical protein Pla133_36300 [Planctomycetes bacterium Pla133]QDV02857.1 hypothetical protein Pla86_36280 [Planctomycetes bacterium Pla86]
MKHACLLPLLLLATLTSTGCLFGGRHVKLEYPAMAAVEPAEGVTAGPKITIKSFVDARSRKVIGEVRGPDSMPTDKVKSDGSVIKWVRAGLEAELAKAGLTPVAKPGPGTPVLQGKLISAYCNALASYDAEVSFLASLERNGVRIFDRLYTGSASIPLDFGATEDPYAEALNAALGDALSKLIVDLPR